MHSILRQQEAQFVAVGGCGCLNEYLHIITGRVGCGKLRDKEVI